MKLIQVAQRAVDLDRASAFYSRLLGSAPSGRFDPPGLLFFDHRQQKFRMVPDEVQDLGDAVLGRDELL